MRTITEFLNYSNGSEKQVIFENVLENDIDSLYECYMEIYREMSMLNEGFFSNLGKKIASWGNKAATA